MTASTSSLPPDPYRILGVAKEAKQQEIRTAYKKLVLQCHPDKVPDPALKAKKQDEFQRVQQAYELLNDDMERAKYDDKVKLAELRREMARNMPNTSSPRAATRSYEIRTAEPRFATSHATPPPAHAKVYAQYPPSRSWDDEMHTRSQGIYDDGRRARRTASYEKPSRRDDDKREERRRDDERRREEERRKDEERRRRDREREKEEERRERERRREKEALKEAQKEAQRAEKRRLERLEKERDKERRRESEEKRRNKSPYVEPSPADEEDEVYTSVKSEKKKTSSAKKHDAARERSLPRDASPRPTTATETETKAHQWKQYAASYIESARIKGASTSQHPPPFGRSATFHEPSYSYAPPPGVPTPPPAPFTADEDAARRSSARASGRRASHDAPIRAKERPPMHRKSSSREDPVVVDVEPEARRPPPLKKSQTMPVTPQGMSDIPFRHLPRAHTQEFSRPVPPLPRAHTFDEKDTGRRSSFPHYEDADSEEDRHHRRSRRHRSPEPSYIRYAVDNGRARRMDSFEREESPSTRKHKPTNVQNPAYRNEDYVHSGFPKVKTAKSYGPEDVQYSNMAYQEPATMYAY